MSKIRIRLTKDTNVVHTLDAQVFNYNVHYAVSTDGGTWWIVYDGETPIGYAGAVFFEDKNMVYLSRAGILPSHRGLGLQKKLIQRRIQWAQKKGAKLVCTYTDLDNIYSSNNLIACGFSLYLPDLPWGNSDSSLYWKKELENGRKAEEGSKDPNINND